MNHYPRFKVSVSCFTYNQAKYITDTMNGFCMQKTNFPYICMIVDDASTDGAQEVIKDYVNKNFLVSDTAVAYTKETDYAQIIYAQHKDNINCFFAVLFLRKNHYSQHKSKMPYLKEWREPVEYEALCEGDDYWICSDKLQMQIDYLDTHIFCGLVRTDVNRLYQMSGNIEKDIFKTTKYKNVKDTFVDYLLNAWWAAPCTWVYRIKARGERSLPDNCFAGDISVLLQISLNYGIAYLNKTTSVYRVLEESASHFKDYSKNVEFAHRVANTRCYFAKMSSSEVRRKLFIKLCKETRVLLINRTVYFSKIFLFLSYILTYYKALYKKL